MKLSLATALTFIASQLIAQTVRPYAPELFPEDRSGAVCGFSPDGHTIYFVREEPGKDMLWMYEAKRIGKYWADEKLLPFSGINSDMGGRFNHDHSIFYFTSNRPGGSYHPEDVWNIWRVVKTENGWGEPVPLKDINNKGMECCPVPLADGNLMFSGSRGKDHWQLLISNGKEEFPANDATVVNAWQWPSYEVKGHYLLFNSMKRTDSKGMDDIYISKWENNAWGPAQNIGEPVNTKVYEDGAVVSPDGTLLIFCRHDTGETPSRVMCVEWSVPK